MSSNDYIYTIEQIDEIPVEKDGHLVTVLINEDSDLEKINESHRSDFYRFGYRYKETSREYLEGSNLEIKNNKVVSITG